MSSRIPRGLILFLSAVALSLIGGGMKVLQKKTRKGAVLDPKTARHGQTGWVDGLEYLFDRFEGEFVLRDRFFELRSSRAEANRAKHRTTMLSRWRGTFALH